MRILVFGKNGQVASALHDLSGEDEEFVFVGRNEADLASPGAAKTILSQHRPDIAINAAAYTAVDNAESEPDAAHRLNAGAPLEMAKWCAESGAVFLHLSTDYVFDGTVGGQLDENTAARPLNVYGVTKLEGENAVLDTCPEAVILRTSWIFSEYGSNFVKTMLRLAAERDALNIVADQIGGPTDAYDIARALIALAGKKYRGGPGSGVYHFQGAPAVSWAEFAEKIFEIARIEVNVAAIATSDYTTPALRPLNTVLDCARIERDFGVGQPDWRIGLRRVITALNNKEQD